jgi:hypothetical protein
MHSKLSFRSTTTTTLKVTTLYKRNTQWYALCCVLSKVWLFVFPLPCKCTQDHLSGVWSQNNQGHLCVHSQCGACTMLSAINAIFWCLLLFIVLVCTWVFTIIIIIFINCYFSTHRTMDMLCQHKRRWKEGVGWFLWATHVSTSWWTPPVLSMFFFCVD